MIIIEMKKTLLHLLLFVCQGSIVVTGQSTLTKFHLYLGDHFDLIGKMLCTLSVLSGI